MTARTEKTASVVLALGGIAAMSYAIRRRHDRANGPLSRVITISRPPADLERLWRDTEVRATVLGEWRTWTDRVSAQFREARPERWGSEMTLTLNADGFAGTMASAVPAVTNRALQKILHRFKALVETGEMPTLAKNPAGRRRIIQAA
jgi:hypothetical protein